MTRTPLTLITLAILVTPAAQAQESARARAQRTLPADVFASVSALAAEGSSSGIPGGPLFNKALEGVAKRVPMDRLMPAIEALAGRLGRARNALGPSAAVPLLVAGADALQRGLPADALRALDSEATRSPTAVLVLTELHETGVPTDRALQVLREATAQRTREDRMLDIPADVRRLIRDGRQPSDAADQVRRGLQRGRGNGDVGPPVPPGSEPTTDRVAPKRPRGG